MTIPDRTKYKRESEHAAEQAARDAESQRLAAELCAKIEAKCPSPTTDAAEREHCLQSACTLREHKSLYEQRDALQHQLNAATERADALSIRLGQELLKVEGLGAELSVLRKAAARYWCAWNTNCPFEQDQLLEPRHELVKLLGADYDAVRRVAGLKVDDADE